MRKWFATLVLSLLLAVQLPITALAEDGSLVSAVSAYGLQDKLYTFVQMGDNYDGSQMKGRVSQDTTGEEVTPLLLTNSDSTVRYLLMIDLSGSMKNYINDVNEFVSALMEYEKMEAVFTVAAFGERFETKAENLTDEKAVLETLNNLEYNEPITNPYDGIVNALNYLNSCSRLGGELVNLILITDGQTDLGYSSDKEEKKAEQTEAQKAAAQITASPEVVIHTLGLETWNETAFSTFSLGTGLDLLIDEQTAGTQNTLSAAQAGKQMAAFTDNLYRSDFKLSGLQPGERFDIQLRFTGQTKDGLYAVPEVELTSVPVLRNASSSGNTPSASTDDLPKTTSSSEEDSETITPNASIEEDGEKEQPTSFLLVGLFAVVIIFILILLISKKKKAVSQNDQDRKEAAIFMRLEIISGQCIHPDQKLYLHHELLIGSDSCCDIVWESEDVAPKNSRIFIREQIIYIEDLNSPQGTALGGMRLYAENRLRSGDEISIGSVHFRLWF